MREEHKKIFDDAISNLKSLQRAIFASDAFSALTEHDQALAKNKLNKAIERTIDIFLANRLLSDSKLVSTIWFY